MVKAEKIAMPHGHFSASFRVPQIINRRQHRCKPPCCKTPIYFQTSKQHYFKAEVASAIDNDNLSTHAAVERYEFLWLYGLTDKKTDICNANKHSR